MDYKLEVSEVSPAVHNAAGAWHPTGAQGRIPGPAAEHQSYGSFLSFSDLDGNTWFVQEITTRLPGR